MGSVPEDLTLTCVPGKEDFVFPVKDQLLFEKRGFRSPPKRCKRCHSSRRRKKRTGGQRGGAPKARQADNRHGNTYRGPAFADPEGLDGIYRSPAFPTEDSDEEIYRAPAFQDAYESDEDIYRAPAFRVVDSFESIGMHQDVSVPTKGSDKNHDLETGPPPSYREPTKPEEMYRSPAFADDNTHLNPQGNRKRRKRNSRSQSQRSTRSNSKGRRGRGGNKARG